MFFFKHHIFCCTNRRASGHTRGCCAEKDAEGLRDYMKSRVKDLGLPKTRVNNAGCLDRCEKGPCIVIYPEGVWYSCKTREDIDEVISKHLQEGQIIDRLVIPEEL